VDIDHQRVFLLFLCVDQLPLSLRVRIFPRFPLPSYCSLSSINCLCLCGWVSSHDFAYLFSGWFFWVRDFSYNAWGHEITHTLVHMLAFGCMWDIKSWMEIREFTNAFFWVHVGSKIVNGDSWMKKIFLLGGCVLYCMNVFFNFMLSKSWIMNFVLCVGSIINFLFPLLFGSKLGAISIGFSTPSWLHFFHWMVLNLVLMAPNLVLINPYNQLRLLFVISFCWALTLLHPLVMRCNLHALHVAFMILLLPMTRMMWVFLPRQ